MEPRDFELPFQKLLFIDFRSDTNVGVSAQTVTSFFQVVFAGIRNNAVMFRRTKALEVVVQSLYQPDDMGASPTEQAKRFSAELALQ